MHVFNVFIIVMHIKFLLLLLCVQKHTFSSEAKNGQKTSKNAVFGHFGIWRVPPFCTPKNSVFWGPRLSGNDPKNRGEFRKIDKSKKAQKRPFLTIFSTPQRSRVFRCLHHYFIAIIITIIINFLYSSLYVVTLTHHVDAQKSTPFRALIFWPLRSGRGLDF